MSAISQDNNWLKLIGIITVLTATMLLYQCSQGFVLRAQYNAPLLVRSVCLQQITTYEQTGRFIENLAAQGTFPNPYPEFYTHSTRHETNQVFHYATSKSPYLKSYVGLVVGRLKTNQTNSVQRNSAPSDRNNSAIAIVCEANKPGDTPATDPIADGSTLTCQTGTQQIGNLLRLR